MTLERINPAELARPSGFAHAVRATGTVTVHLAGQTALDRDGADRRGGRRRAVRAGAGQPADRAARGRRRPRAPGQPDDLHRRRPRLPGARPRDRAGLAAAGRHATTRRWPASASPGCGTTRRWSRCRAPRRSRPADARRVSDRVGSPRGACSRAGGPRVRVAAARTAPRRRRPATAAAAGPAAGPGRGSAAAARRSASARSRRTPRRRTAAAGPSAAPGPVGGDERRVRGGSMPGQVPPLAHPVGQRGVPEVLAAEEVDVPRQTLPLERAATSSVSVPGRRPDARRHRPEAEPGQPGAQLVPLSGAAPRAR